MKLPPLLITFIIVSALCGVAITVMMPRSTSVAKTATTPNTEFAFDNRWLEPTVKKQDRLDIMPQPRRQVPDVQIVPMPAPAEPELIQIKVRQEEPVVRRKHIHREGNVCTRHNLRKVYTRGGRSWRCRR